MNNIRHIVIKSIVRPYYRRNAGLLIFIAFIMVIVVGKANEAGLLSYHYSLITGMLRNPGFLLVVMLLWLLYALKCLQFVVQAMAKREYFFLYSLNIWKPLRVYLLFLQVQVILFLPISSYGLLMAAVGYWNRFYLSTSLALCYMVAICMLSALAYFYFLLHPVRRIDLIRRLGVSKVFTRYYWTFFILYILREKKLLLLGIKAYSCTTLYLMLLNHDPSQAFMQVVFLFYTFGLFGHGVLAYQLRKMEDVKLAFYRGMPVSLWHRWLQYAWLYFLLFVPELAIILRLTPAFMSPGKIIILIFFGYSLLLLLNSLLFIGDLKRIDYFKWLTIIFFLVYACLLSQLIAFFAAGCWLFSTYLFFARYYLYEAGFARK